MRQRVLVSGRPFFLLLSALLLGACGQQTSPVRPAIPSPLQPQAVTAGGVYSLQNVCGKGVLDVSGVSKNDGANVQIWGSTGNLNQQWKLVATDSGYYQLIAQHSGKALDVRYGGAQDGTNVWQYTLNNTGAQQWKPVDLGNGFVKLVSRFDNGKVLDVDHARTANGTNVQLWTDNGSCAQQWKLTAVDAGTPLGASQSVKVSVPANLRAAPFDQDRFLTVPPGFAISVYARIPGARFLLPLPNGDLLVSQPSTGKVLLVRPGANGAGAVSDFATGLRSPHDLVLDTQNGTSSLYLSESNRVTRSVYAAGDTTRQAAQTVVDNLPDASTPELKGAYAHALKNIAIGADHKLYVSVASATNADPTDVTGAFKRAAIYQYNADGSGGRLFAQGIRNAEGLAFVPGTSELWVAVNNRDNIAYPFHNDWQGDGSGDDYGKVMQSYVDNHPPEEFTKVRDGGNYGWPYCNPNPDGGPDNMPFDRDAQNNPDGSKLNCASADRISKGVQAHSAPLGLSFLQNSKLPAAYKSGAAIALHGCWNCSKLVGSKVIFFPWKADGTPGGELDLVTGWVTDPINKVRWGRPVDAAPDANGNLLISDDTAGAIYKLSPQNP